MPQSVTQTLALEVYSRMSQTAAATLNLTVAMAGLNLLPSHVATAKSKAAANTAQWQAFKARLDAALTQILGDVNPMAYQGSELTWIADYALGYQCLKDSDPLTAANYADKTIALVKSALGDFQKQNWMAKTVLARGDGSTATFTLPHADLLPSTVVPSVASVTIKTVTRGAGVTDVIDWYQTYLKVSNTSDGPADYVEGLDWLHDPNQQNNTISWLAGGKQPAAGATYYVTQGSPFAPAKVPFTLSGQTLTLATAPAANQVLFVEYIYGTHSADGSTLAYQQTSAGDGGFNSIFVDSTYTSRYLGLYVALAVDWLAGYAGFSSSLEAAAIAMLVRWSDYIRDNGYLKNCPPSNYGIGGFNSRVFTALALQGRSGEASRLLNEVTAYRTANVLPALQNATTSLLGGFWAEGWNYGALAVSNLLRSALALEDAGQITATAERQWASSVIACIIESQPTPTTVYDGGDGFAYPAPFPGKDLFKHLASLANDPAAQSYANWILQNYAGSPTADAWDVMLRDPAATAANGSSVLPPHYLASGTGLLTARSDWGTMPVWVSFQLGNLLFCDHQSYTPGQLQIQRGGDALLVNACAVLNKQTSYLKSTYGNTIVVDDNGDGAQNYRWSMGIWYGTPGCAVTAYEADSTHVYMAGDYHAAYSNNTAPGAGGSTSELTRDVLYIRPNYVIVFDRVTTIKDVYPKQQRWHFLAAPTVNGNAFTVTQGNSRLFGITFATIPLSTSVTPITGNSKTVQELITQNAQAIAKLRYLSAFQVADTTVAAMDVTGHIVSTDGQLEGVSIGSAVVLFASTPPWSAPSTYSFTAPAGTTTHYVTGLPGGRVCTLTGADQASATVSGAGVLLFVTMGTGSPQTVTIA